MNNPAIFGAKKVGLGIYRRSRHMLFCLFGRSLRLTRNLQLRGQQRFVRTMRNVEIKARILDKEDIKTRAKMLSKSDGIVIKQHDTFFKVSNGRFKMRQFEDGSGELIHYERPDTEGPKLSDFVKTTICKDEIQGLLGVLKKSNGIIGVVKKIRLLYIVDQTRVHIDNVDGLGDFMELEVVLNDEQSLEDGQKIADELMTQLGVKKEDLISGAYLDMIKADDK